MHLIANYLHSLFGVPFTGYDSMLLMGIATLGGVAWISTANARRDLDNGLAHSSRRITILAVVLAWFLLGLLFLSTPWWGEHSLVGAVLTFGACLPLGDATARRIGMSRGYTHGTGLTALLAAGNRKMLAVGAVLWLLTCITGLLSMTGAMVAAFVLPILATNRATTMTDQQQREFDQAKSVLAVALSVPESALNPGDWTGSLQTGIDITNVPAVAAVKLGDLDARLAQVYPMLGVQYADPSHVVLVPLTAEMEQRRQIEAQTGGLLTAETGSTAWGATPMAGDYQAPEYGGPAAPVADADAGTEW